ncbi:MAG TPA: ATP-binding protein [Arcobacter sp.]|nr:ATP-binding protein [Arcobacter sp.]
MLFFVIISQILCLIYLKLVNILYLRKWYGTMLVNFRIENFKSFKDYTEFSMEATKLKNLVKTNVFEINNISLLKSAVIYGANASGKSNLINAMKAMKNVVKTSTDIAKSRKYPQQSFLLNAETENKPNIFEIEFIIDETIYRYGFSIYAKGLIEKEWLNQKKLTPRSQWIELFDRKKQSINIGRNFSEGKQLEEKTRDNALFLSVVAQFNGEKSLKILNWFSELDILSNIDSKEFEHISFKMLEDINFKERIKSFIKSADIGIQDINHKKLKFEDLEFETEDLNILPEFILDELKNNGLSTIETSHFQYDKDNMFKEVKKFPLNFESVGTQRLLALSAPIIRTLHKGGTLIIDELDNSLHTDLVEAIVKLFNSNESNPNCAQLIFTTHDTNLLNQELLRRDQIWFTQKDVYGASELYSLVEYGKGSMRNDLALEKNYLEGKFGGKPHIISLEYEGK